MRRAHRPGGTLIEVDDASRPAGRGFEEFVAADGDRLLRAAYGMCGDWQHAEDLVQAALLKVAQRWEQIDDPLGYAYRCVSRATVDRWRLLRRRPESITEPSRLPEEPADERASDQHLDLVAALHALPPRMRAIVVLRYLHDRSEAETAELLGISRGAVKSGASRALAKLRASTQEADR